MSKPTRRTFEFNEATVSKIDDLTQRFAATSHAEAVRRAIDLAHRLTGPDTKVHLQNGDDKIKEVIFL